MEMMDVAMRIVAMTMITGRQFFKMCTKMMRESCAPKERVAII